MVPSADVPTPVRAVPTGLVRVLVLVPGLAAMGMIAVATAGQYREAVPAILAWPLDSFLGGEWLSLAFLLLLAIAAHPIHPRWWTALLTLAGCVLWSFVGFLVFCAGC